ncbi:T6SS immunity protein Tli4 family protein [Pseudoduganella sp. HUAS MS19]
MTRNNAFVAIFVAALGFVPTENKGREMDQAFTNRIVGLFGATRTVCVGRVVLEVPADSDVTYGPARLPYPIERWPGHGERFDEILNKRLVEIAQDGSRARGPLAMNDSMFGKAINGSVADQRIVFGAAKATGSFYSIESIQKVGQDLYMQKTTAYGNAYQEAVTQLNRVAPLLRPRLEDEVPSEPGICLDGAFIMAPPSSLYEAVTLGVRLRRFPDVHFSIEMITKDQNVEDDSLEARTAAAEIEARRLGAGVWYDRVKIFRRGARKIGSWMGSEFLARKPGIGHVKGSHEFAYFSHGEPGNAMTPAIDIELDTGVKGNKASGMESSLTDEEALYLWDKITSSIRPWPFVASQRRKPSNY